jgi:hypothetical protein
VVVFLFKGEDMSEILENLIITELRQIVPTELFSEVKDDQRKLANAISSAVSTYLRTHVLVPVIPVTTVGTPTAQAGSTTTPVNLIVP